MSSEICPKCATPLEQGKAFVHPVGPVLDITTDVGFSVALVDCQKCPRCGYSELPLDHQCATVLGNEVRAMSPGALAHYQVFGRRGLRWDRESNQYVVDENPVHPPTLP